MEAAFREFQSFSDKRVTDLQSEVDQSRAASAKTAPLMDYLQKPGVLDAVEATLAGKGAPEATPSPMEEMPDDLADWTKEQLGEYIASVSTHAEARAGAAADERVTSHLQRQRQEQMTRDNEQQFMAKHGITPEQLSGFQKHVNENGNAYLADLAMQDYLRSVEPEWAAKNLPAASPYSAAAHLPNGAAAAPASGNSPLSSVDQARDEFINQVIRPNQNSFLSDIKKH